MPNSPKVEIGTKVMYDGETYTVTGFDGGTVAIKSTKGRRSRLSLPDLFGARDFEIVGTDPTNYEPTFPDLLSPEQRKSATEMQAHIREFITGFKSGVPDLALPGEPRPGYEPDQTDLTSRLRKKSTDLGMGERTLWKKYEAYQSRGLMGLVDGRSQKPNNPTGKLDSRVRQAILDVLSELIDKSTTTKDHIRRLVIMRLDAAYGKDEVPCPKKTAFNKALNELAKGRAFFGSSKGRRSTARLPDTPYRRFNATRPGEFVLIDSTPLDAFAIDPVSYRWIGLQLTIALDLFTRSIVAWRFTPKDAGGVDAALLLYDIIKPEPMRPEWDKRARFDKRYVGIPEALIIEAGFQGAAAIPMLNPENVVIDRGKIFLSKTFFSACEHMGVNIYISRPRTPTDKSHIERVFKTIREQFVQPLPGYKGPEVYARGLDVEADALYFADEIEERFAEWVAIYWQERHHDGLDLDGAPKMDISPNEMYEEGISRAGFIYAVPSETLYFDLLPTEMRTIQQYGVELRGLRYDGGCLNYFRNQTSPYGGEGKGKWPLHYDPRDLSKIFFWDHVLEEWKTLYWVGMPNPYTPFNESTVTYAKSLLRERGGNTRNHDQLERELLNLLVRIENHQFHTKEERRLAARQAIQVAQAAKDRGMAGNNVVPLDSFRDEPFDPDAPAFMDSGAEFVEGADFEEDFDESNVTVDDIDSEDGPERRRTFPLAGEEDHDYDGYL